MDYFLADFGNNLSTAAFLISKLFYTLKIKVKYED